MTCKINADASTGLEISSDTSQTIDIQANDVTKMTIGSTIDIQGNEFVLDADADSSIHMDNDDRMDFKTGGTDRFVIDAEGQMLFGGITSELTNNGGCMQLKSRTGSEHCATFRNGVSDGGFGINFQRVDGTQVGSIAWTSSVTNFNTSSDYRLKENVTYTFDATTELKKLKPCKFNFKNESDTIEGFLAHEVSDVVPLAVTGTKDAKDSNDNPVFQSIDQSKLVPLLVKTIQELEARITALESE